MKNLNAIPMANWVLVFATALIGASALAGDVFKADNTNALNLDTSWTTTPQPGSNDVAVWDSTITVANTAALGGNLSWKGIRIANPTGTVTISTGSTLTLGTSGIDMSAATSSLTIAAAVSFGGAQTLNVLSGRNLTLSGTLTNSLNNALVITGAGTFTTASTMSGAGSVSISGGMTVAFGNGAGGNNLGTGPLSLNNVTFTGTNGVNYSATGNTNNINGNVTFSAGSGGGKNNYLRGTNLLGATVSLSIGQVLAVTGAITDGGNGFGMTKSGSANMSLSGDSTYTGTTTISGGTLTLGGTLTGAGSTTTTATGSLSPNSAIVNNANLTFLRSTSLVQGVDFSSAAITGTGSVTLAGAGSLELNAANTYAGATTLSGAGNLTLKHALAIQNSALTNSGTATTIFDSAAGSAFTVGALSGSSNLSLLNSASAPIALTLNGVAANYTGALSGTGATLIKLGAGKQTIGGATANTYTGLTTISGGQMDLTKTAGVDAIGTGGALINTTGILQEVADEQINNSAQVEIGTGGTWNNSAAVRAETVGTVLLNGGTISANSATNTFTITATTFDLRSGTIGANVFLNGLTTPLNISSGTLTIGSPSIFTSISAINLSGTGRLNLNVTDQSLAKLATPTGTGVVAGTFLRLSQNQSAAGAGNGPGTIFGTLELNLATIATNYGISLGSGSTLQTLINSAFTPTSIDLLGNSTIDFGATTASSIANGISTSTSGAKVLTLTGTANSGVISGVITDGSGSLSIVKTGTGKVNLTNGAGTSNFSGGLTIKAGNVSVDANLNSTLAISSAGTGTITLGDSGGSADATLGFWTGAKFITNPIVVASGSTGNALTLQNNLTTGSTFSGGITMNHDLVVQNISSGTSTISTNGITNNGFKITVNNSSVGGWIISSAISGSGAIEQNSTGTGALTLSGANASYTGAITITRGGLTASATSALGATGSTVSVNGTLTLGVTSGTTNYGGGQITLNDLSALALGFTSDGVAQTGKIALAAAATSSFFFGGSSGKGLVVGTGGVDMGSGGTGATLNLSLTGSSVGSIGGVVTLRGNSTINTMVSVGGVVNLALGVTESGASYSLLKTGTGTLILGASVLASHPTAIPGAASTYTGSTTVDTGILRIGIANSLPDTALAVNSGATFDLSTTALALSINSATFDQRITGLIDGTGGGGTIVGNTNNVANTGNIQNRTLTLDGASGTFSFSGVIQDKPVANTTANNKLSVTKSGNSTQILNGTSTYTGDTLITGGNLKGTGTLSSSTVKFTSGGSLWPGLADYASAVTSNQIMHVNAADFANGKLKIALNASNSQILDLTSTTPNSSTLGGILSLGVPSGFVGGPFTIITTAATYTGTFSSFQVNGTTVTDGTEINVAYLPNSVTVTFNSPGVTPVKIDNFAAKSEDAGVHVSWTAVSEYQNAGFNIYRRALESSEWIRVNPALIAGRITNPDEKKYTYFDWASAGMYEYKLESIDLSGAREVHDKFTDVVTVDSSSDYFSANEVSAETVASAISSIGMEAGTRDARRTETLFAALRAPGKNQTVIRQKSFIREAALRSITASTTADNSMPMQPAVGIRWFSSGRIGTSSSYSTAKVVYKDAGVLLIPQSSMPEGFDLNQVSIQREGRNMTALAKAPGGLLVYAPGYKDDYTDKDALFLRKRANTTVAGNPLPATGLFSSVMPVNVTSLTTITNEYHDVYFDYSLRPYSFEPWFSSKYLTQGSAQVFALKLQDFAGGSAQMVVNLWSLTSNEGVNPDHGMQLLVNGQAVGETSWDGGGKMLQLSFTIPSGALKTGDNVLTLVTPTIAGQDSQIAFVHSISTTYSRALDGSKSIKINNSTNAASLYELYNVPADGTWVVDARFSDRASLVSAETLAQADGTLRLRFIAQSGGSGKYLIVPMGQENRPAQVSARQVKPLKLNGSYLATGPAQFASGVQPLLMKRAKEGIRGSFVDQESLFDYYNYGRFGPDGIRKAVRSVSPTYLLLVGRTTYDYLNYGGVNVDPLCPAYLVSTSFWAQSTSDSMFGDLGRGYPEVAVGRLPVNNTSELAGAVSHIVNYKGIPQSGARLHAVADKTDPLVADFGAQLDSMLKANNPEMSWQENYLEKTYATANEVTAAMKAAANGRADLILYSGHGNAARLGATDPRILDQKSVQEWTGNTVFIQATCTANWMAKNEQDYKSIAIQALTQAQGGISASIGTSTYMNPDVAVAFVNQLLKNSSKNGMRWGTALLISQQWAARQGGNTFYNDMIKTEQLFGDPAMPVFASPSIPGAGAFRTTSAGTF